MSEVDKAIDRAQYGWDTDVSHVESEQAFSDRATLATEVKRLRNETVAMEDELRTAEEEIRELSTLVLWSGERTIP